MYPQKKENKSWFSWFKRDKQEVKPVKKELRKRSFIGAKFTKNNRFNTNFNKINAQLRQDYIALTLRARSLAKNSAIVSSYINLFIKNVIGSGFHLNVTAYNDDNTSDLVANNIIEKHWNEYTKSYKNYVSADQQMNEIQFDKYILFNYLVDGQVFIRKIKDPKSKYGIRFELIDALDIDVLYSLQGIQSDGTRISMGIKVDEHEKPISYFLRKNRSLDYYLAGERIEIPADEIIHIYQKKFAYQTRGYTPLAPALLELNSLDEYKRAEIDASILNANWFGVWEAQNNDADSYSQYDEDEVDEKGDIPVQLESNVIRYAPKNYKLNSVSSNHPNTNVDAFQKAMLKGISASLGVSYNHLASDYESINYSSLRQANLDDEATFKELQQMIIDNWKEIQYAEWLKYLLLSDLTILPYSKIEKFSEHDFRGVSMPYIDPAKEFKAIQMRLALGLSSPIEEMHNLGIDPLDVANSIQKWQSILKDRNIKLNNNIYLDQNDNINDNPEQEE